MRVTHSQLATTFIALVALGMRQICTSKFEHRRISLIKNMLTQFSDAFPKHTNDIKTVHRLFNTEFGSLRAFESDTWPLMRNRLLDDTLYALRAGNRSYEVLKSIRVESILAALFSSVRDLQAVNVLLALNATQMGEIFAKGELQTSAQVFNSLEPKIREALGRIAKSNRVEPGATKDEQKCDRDALIAAIVVESIVIFSLLIAVLVLGFKNCR